MLSENGHEFLRKRKWLVGTWNIVAVLILVLLGAVFF